MPRKKEVDSKKLLKAVESGVPVTQLLNDFGLKTSAQVKIAYLDALMEKGQVTSLVSGRKAAATEKPAREIQVNKRGSLIIPREMVEEFGFDEGQVFQVTKTKSGVSLKRFAG